MRITAAMRRRAAMVTRQRVARSRLATGGGFAWKYLYDLTGPDGATLCAGYDRLGSIEREARRLGFRPVRAWEG